MPVCTATTSKLVVRLQQCSGPSLSSRGFGHSIWGEAMAPKKKRAWSADGDTMKKQQRSADGDLIIPDEPPQPQPEPEPYLPQSPLAGPLPQSPSRIAGRFSEPPPKRPCLAQEPHSAIYCRPCDMWLNGPVQYQNHRIGKKHRKNSKAMREKEKARKPLPGILEVDEAPSSQDSPDSVPTVIPPKEESSNNHMHGGSPA